MRISLFAKGADLSRDLPISRHSEFYITDMIRDGRAVMLLEDAYHRPAAMLTKVSAAFHNSREHKLEHGTFADAWGTAISGYAGPQVMQMRRTDVRMQVPA